MAEDRVPGTDDRSGGGTEQPDAIGAEGSQAAQPDPDDVEVLRAELARLRAENEALRARASAEPRLAEGAASASMSRPRRSARWAASVVLIVIGSLLVPASITAVWLDRTISDTDRYVETVAPLARDPEIRKAVSARLERALFERVDIQAEVRRLLPDSASPLAAPIAAALRSLAGEIITRALESDQFVRLWEEANRAASEQVVAVLTNSSGRRGVVQIDLNRVADEVAARLEERGIPFASNLADADVTFDVFQSEEVAQVQDAFRLLDRLSGILPWATVIILAVAILVAPNRRRGLLFASTGWVIGCAALLVAVAVGRTIYFDSLPVGASMPANEAFFDTISRFLRGGTRTMLALGMVFLLLALLTGPSGPAVRLRSWVSRLFSAAGGAAGEHGLDLGPVGAWVTRNVVALRVAVGVAALVWFISLSRPSAGNVLWIAGFGVAALAVIEVVTRISTAGSETTVRSGAATGSESEPGRRVA